MGKHHLTEEEYAELASKHDIIMTMFYEAIGDWIKEQHFAEVKRVPPRGRKVYHEEDFVPWFEKIRRLPE